jgi:hypothetical protein
MGKILTHPSPAGEGFDPESSSKVTYHLDTFCEAKKGPKSL